MRSMKLLNLLAVIAAPLFFTHSAVLQGPVAPQQPTLDPYTFASEHHFVRDFPARVDGGLVNVVVEIPAGTTAKWEVDKRDGALRWEMRDGKPRVVKYLGYPGNYGMVPRTLLPKDLGGDGDPLDVILLGPAVERGSVIPARIVGVLELLDGGEQDDKLLAVTEGSAFANVTSLQQLDREFPGVTTIVRAWFEHYKGQGVMEAKGFADVARAQEILDAAIGAYAAR